MNTTFDEIGGGQKFVGVERGENTLFMKLRKPFPVMVQGGEEFNAVEVSGVSKGALYSFQPSEPVLPII